MIGERIKARREELGMTQEELAAKVGYKHKTSISRIEKNKSDISTSDVFEFADALETTVQYLMGWEALDSTLGKQEMQMKELSRKLTMFEDLIDAYDSADSGIKSAVDKLLDIDEDHMSAKAAHNRTDFSDDNDYCE